MEKVSVIINCYNGEEFLRECLDSVRDQTLQDYEIIFWDNCSTDRSAEIAQSYDKIRYFKGDKLVPLGAARNLALHQATGEYVAYIDCDDLWDRRKLELQVAALDQSDGCGMALTNYQRFNMMKDQTVLAYPNAERKTLDFTDLVMHYHFCLSSFMIRRSAFEGLDHLFNDQFHYAEEFELFSRIAYRWKTAFLPDPLVTYRIHKSMNTRQLQDRKAEEYGIILDNLRKMAPSIDGEYPEAMKWITFNRDFNAAKTALLRGDNQSVRKWMKPYLRYNKRAVFYYASACLPAAVSKQITKAMYEDRY